MNSVLQHPPLNENGGKAIAQLGVCTHFTINVSKSSIQNNMLGSILQNTDEVIHFQRVNSFVDPFAAKFLFAGGTFTAVGFGSQKANFIPFVLSFKKAWSPAVK